MLNIIGIDHIVLRTAHPGAMLDFYTRILGCHVERETSEAFGLMQLRAGNALIDLIDVDSELGRPGGQAPAESGHNLDHFCLQVQHVTEADLSAYLDEQQIPHSRFEDRYGAQGMGHSIYLKDPDGNVIELKAQRPLD